MATGGQVAVTKCDICDENIGTLFCYSCNHYLCQSCELFHQKFPSTKHHQAVNSQNIDKLDVNNKHVCEHHKQDYSLFCTTCDGLICTLCATSEHNGHNFKALSNVVSEARASVEGNILLLKQKKNNISALIEDIKLKKMKNIVENIEHYRKQVKETSKGLTETVKSVRKIDITRVTDHFHLQLRQVEEKLSELKRLSKEFSYLLGECERILSVEHDVTFILRQKTLVKELTQIYDIPRVEEPKLVEKFSCEHFVESVIENIQKNYKVKGQRELESKVSALESEIRLLKDKSKTWQAKFHAECEAKDIIHREKEASLKDVNNLQIHIQQLQRKNDQLKLWNQLPLVRPSTAFSNCVIPSTDFSNCVRPRPSIGSSNRPRTSFSRYEKD